MAKKLAARTKRRAQVKVDLPNEVVLLSGFRNSRIEQFITDSGGRVKSNYARDVTLVVAKDVNSTSQKMEKARAGGKRIISLDDFINLFRGVAPPRDARPYA